MDEVTEHARAAFSHGWALSGGPMTDAVKAAYLVAVDHVREAGLTEQALDVAVDLGAMSGTWALLHIRREQVYAEPLAAIVTAWRRLARNADLRGAIDRYRHNLGLEELADPEKQRRTAEAAAAAVMALHILVDLNDPAWQAFVDALANGVSIAQAEGVAGAVGVAAAHAGVTGIDFQAAYDDARAAPPASSDTDAKAAASAAAVAIVRGATTDLTRVLVASIRDDLTAEETLVDAKVVLGVDEESDTERGAAHLLGDATLSKAFLGGMLAWFVGQGIRQVNWVTAASACAFCLDLEAKNPWMAFEVPDPPAHPNCRCDLEPVAGSVFAFDFARYL